MNVKKQKKKKKQREQRKTDRNMAQTSLDERNVKGGAEQKKSLNTRQKATPSTLNKEVKNY